MFTKPLSKLDRRAVKQMLNDKDARIKFLEGEISRLRRDPIFNAPSTHSIHRRGTEFYKEDAKSHALSRSLERLIDTYVSLRAGKTPSVSKQFHEWQECMAKKRDLRQFCLRECINLMKEIARDK